MVIALRVFLVVTGILPAILGSTLSAHSDEIPNLDVKQLCRGIASQATDPLAGGEPTFPVLETAIDGIAALSASRTEDGLSFALGSPPARVFSEPPDSETSPWASSGRREPILSESR
jgi:hypothetical protein